jgi:thioredoxin reductase (NADPH)
VAAGAQYRKLALPNLAQFEGVGVYYGATAIEARVSAARRWQLSGEETRRSRPQCSWQGMRGTSIILVRGGGLAEIMSRFLISRIEASREITLGTRTDIEALEGDGHLERIRWRDTTTGTSDTHEVRHLFVMAGEDLGTEWPLRRVPHMLETSLPGVFAVGDIRAGSVKHVASAVGEGSMTVQFVHKVLAE